MIDKLRPAVEVLRDASNALLPPIRGEWASILRMQEKAAAIIEADREAVRAEQARAVEVELAMTAIANSEASSEWIDGFEFAWKRARQALTSYKEQRDAS